MKTVSAHFCMDEIDLILLLRTLNFCLLWAQCCYFLPYRNNGSFTHNIDSIKKKKWHQSLGFLDLAKEIQDTQNLGHTYNKMSLVIWIKFNWIFCILPGRLFKSVKIGGEGCLCFVFDSHLSLQKLVRFSFSFKSHLINKLT